MTLPIKKFKLHDIVVKRYVRAVPSEERIMLFMDLYTSEAAGQVPLIAVKPDGELIDGRHRLIAMQRLDMGETECSVDASVHDICDLTLAAIRANTGGSKDLTFSDLRKSIMDLLAEGFSVRRIRAGLPYPKSMSKRLVGDAQSAWRKARLNAAVIAVKNEELTMEQAAKTYQLEIDDIACQLRKEQLGQVEELQLANMGSAKGAVTMKFHSFSKRLTLFYKKLAEKYELGEFTEAQVSEIVAHSTHQARNLLGHANDWEARFTVMMKTRRPILPPAGERMPPKKISSGNSTSHQERT